MVSRNERRLGSGNIRITLMDPEGRSEELDLVPTFNAARTLSAQHGGLMQVISKIAQLDIDAIVSVITLGLGYGTQSRRAPPDLSERIWRTGFSDTTGTLAAACVNYVQVLMNGGQPINDEDDQDGEDPT